MAEKQKTTSFDLYRKAAELAHELEFREGVTDEELDAELAEFVGMSEDKMDGHRYAIAEFSARAKHLRGESKRLVEQARRCEKIAERIKGYSQLVMEGRIELLGEAAGRKLETPLGSVSLRKSQRVIIENESTFIIANRDSGFVQTKYSIDKRSVKDALDANETVTGAEIVESWNVIFK